MIQASLDQFHEAQYVPVLALQDFEVAWTDRNWYLHAQDIVHVDPELASVLVKRRICRILKMEASP